MNCTVTILQNSRTTDMLKLLRDLNLTFYRKNISGWQKTGGERPLGTWLQPLATSIKRAKIKKFFTAGSDSCNRCWWVRYLLSINTENFLELSSNSQSISGKPLLAQFRDTCWPVPMTNFQVSTCCGCGDMNRSLRLPSIGIQISNNARLSFLTSVLFEWLKYAQGVLGFHLLGSCG